MWSCDCILGQLVFVSAAVWVDDEHTLWLYLEINLDQNLNSVQCKFDPWGSTETLHKIILCSDKIPSLWQAADKVIGLCCLLCISITLQSHKIILHFPHKINFPSLKNAYITMKGCPSYCNVNQILNVFTQDTKCQLVKNSVWQF